MRRASNIGWAFVLLAAGCPSTSEGPIVSVAAEAMAVDSTTVEITFTHPVLKLDRSTLLVTAPFERPVGSLEVQDITIDDRTITIRTAAQRGGALYAVTLGEIVFVDLVRVDAPTQVNFTGYGRSRVVISLATNGFVVPAGVDALITVDPVSGEYAPSLQRVPLVQNISGIFTATVSARIDPDRIHAARAVTPDGREAGQLTTFTVDSADDVHVGLVPLLTPVPEFEPPADSSPGDGRAPVRLVFDDRFARALVRPAVRMSIDETGAFDSSAARVVPLERVAGERRVYEAIVEVEVDPARVPDGTSADTFPYVVFLVEQDEDIPQRGTNFVMPNETPQVIVIPIGNPAMVPVTFRVDAGASFVSSDGATRGRYSGEGIFLTGEFPSARDALGRLAADAFTGGERATLEMLERVDAPGIFEKTIFLPPNRPYGWKVVRCATGRGCAELNRHVVSSGRAFPTVMKNLVTENQDAALLENVAVIDPADLTNVPLSGTTADYSSAVVSTDGSEAPSTTVMFKQEAPDLVVTVAREAVVTPIYVIGTWRDVNIPDTPAAIIMNDTTLELSPFDYDDGTQGRAPLLRNLDLPLDPDPPMTRPGVPAFMATDGVRDIAATSLLGGAVSIAYNERALYVATAPATPGVDRFVVVSLDEPSTLRDTQWAKAGQIAVSGRQMFLAMEGDGDFASWFSLGASIDDDAAIASGAVGRGDVLEGSVDPVVAGIGAFGDRIWICVLEYATTDGGELSVQVPDGDMDLNVSASEFLMVPLDSVRP